MAVQVINAGSNPWAYGGSQFGLVVNEDGSINVAGTINATTGSQVWVQNTISVTPSGVFNVGISGNIVIGSVSATVDSVYIQSGANIDLGSAWTNIGSVLVSNFPITYPGSVSQNTNPWITLGSVAITNTGSIIITNDITQIGSYTLQLVNGSVSQMTNPWIVSGTSTIAGSAYVTGSVNIATSPVPISGNVLISGAVLQGTNPWIVLGSTAVTNQYLGSESFIPAGSVIVTNIVSVSGNLGVVFENDYLNVIQSGTNWAVSGTVNQGTNPWVISGNVLASGTINIFNPSTIGSFTSMAIGSVNINNPNFNLNSVVYQSGGQPAVSGILTMGEYNGSAWTIKVDSTGHLDVVGTVGISSPTTIGSYTLQLVNGSVSQATNPWIVSGNVLVSGTVISVQSTNPWIVSGNVLVSGTVTNIGSVAVTTNPVPISGIVNQGTNPWTISGNILVSGTTRVVQVTDPWIISGNALISGTVIVASPTTIGSFTSMALGSVAITNIGSVIQSTNPWIVSGNVLVSGAVNQGTNPWIVSGNMLISGTIIISSASTIGSFTSMALGSVAITNIGSVIQSTSPWVISGNVLVSGAVLQGTSPWVISGNTLVSGTIIVASPATIGSFTSMALGSVAITNIVPISGAITVDTITNRIAGSIVNLPTILGSIYIKTDPVSITQSGTFTVLSNLGSNFGAYQIIRQNAGSPATFWAFSAQSNSFIIENLGSASVYYNFTAAANPANSGTAILIPFDSICYDFRIGSISIQSSGTTSSQVQLIRLT